MLDRTTILLNHSTKNEIKSLIESGIFENQTSFITQAINDKLAQTKKEIAAKEFLDQINNLKRLQTDVSAVEMIRQIRKETQ